MYIIGDIHGTFKTLLKLVESLPIKSLNEIVLVGDLIDRGPMSYEVVEWCIENNIKSVRGNHEDMMLKDIESVVMYYNQFGEYISILDKSDWLNNGGDVYFEQFIENGTVNQQKLDRHVKYLKSLPIYLEFDILNDKGEKLLVTHSSAYQAIRKYNSLKHAINNPYGVESILWDRSSMPGKIQGRYNVFGHTINKKVNFQHWSNVDTGAYRNGYLTALHFPSMMVYKQGNIENG